MRSMASGAGCTRELNVGRYWVWRKLCLFDSGAIALSLVYERRYPGRSEEELDW